MAIMNPGPLAAEVRGSVGGTTFSRNRGGLYARFRASPTQPQTLRQTAARSAIQSLTATWRNVLTQAQRDDWDAFADQNPVTNRIGQQINIGGLGWYVRVNFQRLYAPLAGLIDDPPAPQAFDSFNGNIFKNSGQIVDAEASEGDGNITLNNVYNLEDGQVFGALDNALFVLYMVGPLFGARKAPSNAPMRSIFAAVGNSIDPLAAPIVVPSPVPLAQGQRIFLAGTASFQIASGTFWLSTEQRFEVIVGA